MSIQRRLILVTTALVIASTTAASAHVVRWQTGATRQVDFGKCVKGACMKVASWTPTRPHCHH